MTWAEATAWESQALIALAEDLGLGLKTDSVAHCHP